MKNINFLLFFAAMLAAGIIHSQTLSPSVISSSGGYYTSATASLSFTVAEMAMVRTFVSSDNILTQGFQQSEDFAVGITEEQTGTDEFLIYPNPTQGIFTLSFESNQNGENTIRLYNAVGQTLLTKTITQIQGVNIATFDISDFSQGIYLLEMNTLNEKGEKTIRYQKINLVY